MRKTTHCFVITVMALALGATTPAVAAGKKVFMASLDGWQEVPSLATPGMGTLRVMLNQSEDTLTYDLTYEALGASVRDAHIHLGQPGTNGGVIVFLCSNFAVPSAPPACPSAGGTVNGTLTDADVIGPSAQGIDPGEFEELVRALRAGAAYVNVHTDSFPSGEIRGNIQ